jgi:hypothetical protein
MLIFFYLFFFIFHLFFFRYIQFHPKLRSPTPATAFNMIFFSTFVIYEWHTIFLNYKIIEYKIQ